MTLIGIGHQKQVGKDTVAEMLKEYCTSKGKPCYIYHFADELYRECAELLGITVEEIKKNKNHFRGLLQWYGTDYTKGYLGENDSWVIALEYTLENDNIPPSAIIIVPDTRFLNEVQWIRNQGGILIKVSRLNNMENRVPDMHQSEVELFNAGQWYDYNMLNSGTLEDLKEQVQTLAECLKLD